MSNGAEAFPKFSPKIPFPYYFVFKSNAAFSQTLLVNLGVPQGAAPTLANVVNIIVSVVISYPAMKFWIMPKHA